MEGPVYLRPRSHSALIATAAMVLAIALPAGAVLARGQAAAVTAAPQSSSSRTVASASVSATHTATKAKAKTPPVVAYRGLGTWVDIYDKATLANPAAAVHKMAARGVKTLYVETGNYHTGPAINHADALQIFIREAHAHHMRVVAWYLPNLKTNSVDLGRVKKAIAFRTPTGQKFDSFALDIESGVVKKVTERNRNLAELSKRIRAYAGKTYPLGAIIPSPVGLTKKHGYWKPFPYATIGKYYDAILPMCYYTYHGNGPKAALADTVNNVAILRSNPSCAKKPIHLVGGISNTSSTSETQAFVVGARKTKVFGAGLYDWEGTSKAAWAALKKVPK